MSLPYSDIPALYTVNAGYRLFGAPKLLATRKLFQIHRWLIRARAIVLLLGFSSHSLLCKLKTRKETNEVASFMLVAR